MSNITHHCLNCWKSMRGSCDDFTELQATLFSAGLEIGSRIEAYRELCMTKGCSSNSDIFPVGVN